MTLYFLDSSALIKRYITETGSSWLRALMIPNPNHQFFIAQIAVVEAMSATSRRQREGHVSIRNLRAIRLLINSHVQRHYNLVRLGDDITERAIDLCSKYPLRASDAIQLASAVDVHTTVLSANLSVVFLCADTRLLATAVQEGLTVEDPNMH